MDNWQPTHDWSALTRAEIADAGARGPGLMAHIAGAKKSVGHACGHGNRLQLALRPDERQRLTKRIKGLPPRLSPAYVDDA